jgi:hypothetical protein
MGLGRAISQADWFIKLARKKPAVKRGSIGRHCHKPEKAGYQNFCQQILQTTSGNFPINFLEFSVTPAKAGVQALSRRKT